MSDNYASSTGIVRNPGATGYKTTTTAVSTTVAATAVYVGVTSTAAPRTITLPALTAANDGRFLMVKDESNGAATNNITVAASGGDLIDGSSTYAISQNNGFVLLIARTTRWSILGTSQAGGGGGGITQLSNEVLAGPGSGNVSATLLNSAVIGKVLTGFVASPGTVVATDSILEAIQKLAGNGSGSGITQLTGDVTAGPGTGSQVATLTNSAVTGQPITGFVAGAGTVVATDTILEAIQKLAGNGAGSGVTTVGTYDSQTPSANALFISSNTIYAQSASASNPGMVSTSSQTFVGTKLFQANQNSDFITGHRNLNTSSSAQTSVQAQSDTTEVIKMTMNGSGFSAGGGVFINSRQGVLQTNALQGMVIASTSTGGAGTISFLTSGNLSSNLVATFRADLNAQFFHGLAIGQETSGDASTTIGSQVSLHIVTSLTAARNKGLPPSSSMPGGHILIVKDGSGNASVTNFIQINANGSDTIDGASNVKITTARGWYMLANSNAGGSGGGPWYIVGKG